MKKFKLFTFALILLTLIGNSSTTKITTTAKEYESSSTSTVSTRELALLASIAYEDIPDDRNYKLSKEQTNADLDCFDSKGNFKKNNCFYKSVNDGYVTLANSDAKVYRYIEGMSERKYNSLVSTVTASKFEDGEQYYFLNFATAKELEDKGWKIYDYATGDTVEKMRKAVEKIFKDTISWQGVFSVVTFKKGNNYVIAYRGTDYPDLLEWIQDVGYAINGKHAEAVLAYNYAQEIYEKILKETPNAKIYVTGHSLGGYLAQVGGAAIIDKEANKTYKEQGVEAQKQYQNYEEYKADYYKGNSHLEQVAYFNGMGVDGIFLASDFSVQVQNALVYLSKYEKDGKIASDPSVSASNKTLNYSNNSKSSGRLVLYSMDGDPISSIGLHFGEIYKLEAGADAITNHRKNHNTVLGATLGTSLQVVFTALEKLDQDKRSQISSMLTSALKNMLKAENETQSNSFSYFPKSVLNQIEAETGNANVINYGIGSILENLQSDLSTFADTYDIKNLFDHFNINHETDSFACIKDSSNGSVKDIKLSITADEFNCEGTTCYTNKVYFDKGFKFNLKTTTNDYVGTNIVLTAKINGACAKSYDWYYYKNGQAVHLGTTSDNKIILPNSLYTNLSEGKISYDFYVVANYGDKFTELKATFPQGTTEIQYVRGTSYSGNPTLNDGVSVSTNVTKQSFKSNNINVTLVTDRQKPNCSFSPSTQNEKLKCFLGICKDITVNATLSCTDNLSGISTKPQMNQFKTSDVGLIPSIKLTNKLETKQNGTGQLNYVGVKITRKPTSKTPKITYSGTVKDKAGNSRAISPKVSFKIKS